MEDRHQRLEEHGDTFHSQAHPEASSRFSVQGFNLMDRNSPLSRGGGVTLDKRLTWSSHFDKVRKKAAQRLGVLCFVLNRRRGISMRNGVLLYRQLIRPKMD
jgi:hypothetical protein